MDIINEVIYPVLDIIKEEEGFSFENKSDLELFGGNGVMDSFLIIRFMTLIEKRVSEVYNIKLSLAGSSNLVGGYTPFKSVDNFAKYLSNELSSK